MKKIVLTLAALAALSTAALARTDIDPRDRNDAGSSVNMVYGTYAAPASSAFAVPGDDTAGLSNFQRLTWQSIQNEDSDNN